MKRNKNSSQPNKVHNQVVVTQNEPQQEKKGQNQKDKQKRERTEKMGYLHLLREKPWSNFIQKALLLAAQSAYIHKAKCQ